MSDPINTLLNEHKLILQAIECARKTQKINDANNYREQAHDIILFFRNYTEDYHHPKEDLMLYPLLKGRTEKLSPDLLYLISDNHEDFKGMMAEIEAAFVNYDTEHLRQRFGIYLTEMEDHVKNENKIIFAVAGNLLNASEKEKLQKQFTDWDENKGHKFEIEQSMKSMLVNA